MKLKHNLAGISGLHGSTTEYNKTQTIPQYFQFGFTTGQIQSSNLAIVDGKNQSTFLQLDTLSTQIANAILELSRDAQNQNPDGDRVVGVCMQPSEKLIYILFGILKSNAAYVPIDVSFPEKRICKIVNDCRPLLVICDEYSNLNCVQHSTKVITTEDLYKIISSFPATVYGNIKIQGDVDDTAIILYTSGSSGEPKGVRLSHKILFSRLNWFWIQFPFKVTEKCVFKTAFTFVDSLIEIFGTLLQGFSITIFNKAITSVPSTFMENLHAFEITRVIVVPSLLRSIFQIFSIIGRSEALKLLKSVKFWFCSGEALHYDLLRKFFECFPENITLCNSYGATEVGDVTFVNYTSIRDLELKVIKKRVPIGFPQCNMAVQILDQNLQPVERGCIGEIFIAGSNLAKGYVGMPNSDKFLENPCRKKSIDSTKWYRTGDFGSISFYPNGESVLMYDGRIDSQIKVRGHRVDLLEIELVFSSMEYVETAKVLCSCPGQTDQVIVAFIVPTIPGVFAENFIKQEISRNLRECEQPVTKFLEKIPLLVNGKTDRQQLLHMFATEREKPDELFDEWDSLAVPKDKINVAKILFSVISAVTKSTIKTIVEYLDDSFFHLGGSSLNAVVVIVKMRELGHYISILDFTSAKSVRDILMRTTSLEKAGIIKCAENVRENQPSGRYSFELLTEQDKEEVVDIISYSFSKNGNLEAYVDVSYSDIVTYIKSIWNHIVDTKLSFILRRVNNMKPVGVSLNFDAYDEPSPSKADCGVGINYVMTFLASLESKEMPHLPNGKGKIFHSFMMGISKGVNCSEKVSLVEIMATKIIQIAKKQKFEGVLATFSNPLTMQIGRDIHRYKILNEFQVNLYVAPDGAKPFSLAPDSNNILCCWKKLKTKNEP